MKKILFAVFICLFSLNFVNAESNISVTINGESSQNNYFTLYPGGRNLEVLVRNYSDNSNNYPYILFNVCASSNLEGSYVTGGDNLLIYNTGKSCTKKSTSGSGKLQYIQFHVNNYLNDSSGYYSYANLHLNNYSGYQENIDFISSNGSNSDFVSGLIDNKENFDNVINNQNNNKNDLLNNQNNNKNDILNNQNQNTNDIIQNQNENNDKINNNLQDCRFSKNLFNPDMPIFKNAYIDNKGNIIEDNQLVVYDISDIINNNFYASYFEGLSDNGMSITLYKNGVFIKQYMFPIDNKKLINLDGADKILLSIWKNNINLPTKKIMLSYDNLNYEPYGKEVCQSKLDGINGGIGDINNSINNSNVDDPKNMFDKFNENIANNGPITKLVTLPITLYQSVLNGVNGACKPFNLGNLLGTDLTMPCIDLKSYLGPVIYHSIDLLISGFAIYKIAKHFRNTFDSLSELRGGAIM